VADTLPEKKVSTFIVSMHTHIDEHGRTVDERRPEVGEPPVGFIRFTARASLTGKFDFGTASKKFDVPLPRATTVGEAFAQISDEYPAAMKEAGEELKKEVMEQIAEKTGQAAIASAPASMIDSEGHLRGMSGPTGVAPGGRRRRRKRH
jgi:hypothetical protein